MSTKGKLDTIVDAPALQEIIVSANRLRQECTKSADNIRKVCLNMEEEESLKGGDGDIIREAFASISSGVTNLEKSLSFVTQTLNNNLEKILKMVAGKSTGAMQEETQAATKKMGIFKKE